MKKQKILAIFICLAMIMASGITAFGSTTYGEKEIVYLEDGTYFETVIEESTPIVQPFAQERTKTASKITRHKNASGETLWYVKVTGTFKYDGTSSRCTDSTATAAAPASNWYIKSKSASKSGNTARATATAKKVVNGLTTKTMTLTVKVTCSKNGTIS